MKKNPKAFNELQDEFYNNVKEKGLSEKLCKYVWNVLICMSKGYGFNTSHTLAYSIIALQEANLAYYYPSIYWSCACMISDTQGTVDYGKNASSMSRMERDGVKIVPPDINKSRFDFHPDGATNSIIFGFKPMSGVGAAEAKLIMSHQPYLSMDDFYDKMITAKKTEEDAKFGNTAMISLIKAGAFRSVESDSKEILMERFIRKISSPLTKLSWSNLDLLNQFGLITDKDILRLYTDKCTIFKDKKNIVKQEGKSPATAWYTIKDEDLQFRFTDVYAKEEVMDSKNYEIDGPLTDYNGIAVKRGAYDKAFDKLTAEFKTTVFDNVENLNTINEARFKECWDEKVGSVAKWEFDSCGYYFNNQHELHQANEQLAHICNYFKLPDEPEEVSHFEYKGRTCYRYKLSNIFGTVASKDAAHNTINLLTPDGCVTVKLYKRDFIYYDKTTVEVDENGKKRTIEPSWFDKGTLLCVTGYKANDQFVCKTYKDADEAHSHVLQKINDIIDGRLITQTERMDEDESE